MTLSNEEIVLTSEWKTNKIILAVTGAEGGEKEAHSYKPNDIKNQI